MIPIVILNTFTCTQYEYHGDSHSLTHAHIYSDSHAQTHSHSH